MAALEGVSLDGLNLNDATTWRLQGADFTPPAKRQEWAQGADIDGALLVRDPLFDNREITLRLRVAKQTTMDLALTQVAALSKKLEEAEQQPDGLALVWTPAGSVNSVTFYVLSGTVEGLPIELTGEDAGWFLRAPVVTVKLVCKPFGYGTPVTSSTASSATPFVTITVSPTGDVPAEVRIQATDAATQNRRYLEAGLQWRYYDVATSLLVDSDDMVTSGFSGAQTTRTGAYDPNASGNQVIRGTLAGVPQAICGTGNLGHIGTFRVKARVYADLTVLSIDPANARLRLSWQEGDGPFRSNSYVSPVTLGRFCEVDLGLITIPPKQLGTQRWSGKIEAYTTWGPVVGTGTLDVDYLVLVPADEGYGKARGEIVAESAVSSFIARDEFGQAAGALAGQTLPVGGTWSGAGDADDFAVEATGHTAQRTAVSDTTGSHNGRFGIAGTTAFTDTAVQLDFKASLVSTSWVCGALVRWTDINNFAIFTVNPQADGTTALSYVFRAAGSYGAPPTVFASYALQAGAYYTIRVTVAASGAFAVWFGPQGATTLPKVFAGAEPAFATGGSLASGKAGIFDQYVAAPANTRNYDNFQAWVPTIPTVLYSGRVAELRSDGAIRQDSTGVYYGPVPAYRGSRFLVPPAGDESRTSRILVKAHRNDIEAEPSDNVTDNLTIQTVTTPRYVVVPF